MDVDNDFGSINGEKMHSKAFWSTDEDMLLAKLVATHGPRNWSLIAKSFKKRIGKQCRERWHNHLDPNVRKDAWSPNEDRYILEQVTYLGTKWSVIAQSLPGRTDSAVKNRYHSHLKRVMSQSGTIVEKDESRTSTSSGSPPPSPPQLHPIAPVPMSLMQPPPTEAPATLTRSLSLSAPPRKQRRLSEDVLSSRVTSHVTLVSTPALKTPFFVLSAFQQRTELTDNLSSDGSAPTLYVNPEHLGQKDIHATISVRDLMAIIRRSQSQESLDASDSEGQPAAVECSIQLVADSNAGPFAQRAQSNYNNILPPGSDDDGDNVDDDEMGSAVSDASDTNRW